MPVCKKCNTNNLLGRKICKKCGQALFVLLITLFVGSLEPTFAVIFLICSRHFRW